MWLYPHTYSILGKSDTFQTLSGSQNYSDNRMLTGSLIGQSDWGEVEFSRNP